MGPLRPSDPQYFRRPSSELMRDIPGNCIRTPAGVYVVTLAQGFNTLLKAGMISDFESKAREPGQIVVTSAHGNPLLNVVGEAASGEPQLTWLQEFTLGDRDRTGTAMVTELAAFKEKKLKTPRQKLDYAMENFDGKNLQSTKSEIRLVENPDLPLERRRVAILRHAPKADNSVGFGMLAREIPAMSDTDQLRRVLETIALELKVTVEDLLDRKNWLWAMKKSSRFTRIVRQLAFQAEHQD